MNRTKVLKLPLAGFRGGVPGGGAGLRGRLAVLTDSLVMSGPYERASTEVLRALVSAAEDSQKPGPYVADCGSHLVGFSTALTDDERRYLDLCAELYARGEDAPGRQPCEAQQPRELAA